MDTAYARIFSISQGGAKGRLNMTPRFNASRRVSFWFFLAMIDMGSSNINSIFAPHLPSVLVERCSVSVLAVYLIRQDN